jgi:hypothetical protein
MNTDNKSDPTQLNATQTALFKAAFNNDSDAVKSIQDNCSHHNQKQFVLEWGKVVEWCGDCYTRFK